MGQQVEYIADGAGFRVADSRLPVAPVYDGVAPTFNPELPVAPVYTGVAPTFNPEPLVAPVDTPEVAAAKEAHAAAVAAAAGDRKKRSANPGFSYGFATHHPTYYPYAHHVGYGLPLAGYHGYGYHL